MKTILFDTISQDRFNAIQIKLFENNLINRMFGIITNGVKEYGIAWQSDLILPKIEKIKNDLYSIGIDQNFAIINFSMNKIEFNTDLTYNFCDSYFYKEHVYIISELEILKLNVHEFIISDIYSLPDIFESISFEENKIKVKCMDDENEIILLL